MLTRFVKGETPGLNTGFDIDEVDRHEMSKCDGIVVVSTIFGKYVASVSSLATPLHFLAYVSTSLKYRIYPLKV